MNIELILIPLILLFSFLLFLKDKKSALILLLILSMFLHKEVFSIYRWDVLPVRIFMLSLLAYVIYASVSWLKTTKNRFTIYDRLQELSQDPFIVALTLLWLVRGISIIFTKNLPASLFLFGFFTTITALGYFLYLNFKGNKEVVFSLIKIYINLAFIACLFGFAQLLLYYKTDFIIGALWNVPGRIPRVGSVFWDVNHFGAFIASLMPVLGVLILIAKKWKARIVYASMFALMAGTLLLTNSRTAWLLGFVALITFILALLVKKFQYRGVLALVGVLVLLSLPLIYEYNIKSSPFRAYVKDYFHYRIDSFDSHFLLIEGTLAVFEDNPVLGGGYGGFFEHFITTEVASRYLSRDPAGLNTRVPAHTIWGEQLAETGILGITIFVSFMFVLLGTIFYAGFTTDDLKERLLTFAMGSTIVGYLVGGIFYSYKSEFFYMVLFLYFTYAVSLLKNKFIFSNVVAFYFRSGKWLNIILAITSFLLIFWGLGSTHLIPWDEAIYAKVAKNMLISGDYMSLRWWPSMLWFEKPPLMFWSMAASMKLFGISSFAARLPSALLGFGTIFITFHFAAKLYNKTVGALASIVLLTTFQFLYYSRAAMLDVSLTFFVTLSLYYYWIAERDLKKLYWVLSGLAAGFAVMTKGVVGFLPFFVILSHQLVLLLTNKEKVTKEKIVGFALAVGSSALVFMPWHIYMYLLYGKSFISTYIGYHVLERASHGIEDKGRPWYWYFTVLRVSMRIWFVALLAAFPVTFLTVFTRIRKFVIAKTNFRLYSYKKDLFLVVYALCIFVFFAVAKSKLVWYIMPIYPVLSMVVGLFIERVLRTFIPKKFVIKAFVIYLIFMGSLFYLFLEKRLVYTGDLTYKQAELIELKDELYGIDSKLYADRIELPLLLFYSDGPFEVVDFGPLKDILGNTIYDQSIIFITKESRFRAFKEEHPELDMEDRRDEWVLGYKPSRKEIDLEKLKELQQDLNGVNGDIEEAIKKDRPVSVGTRSTWQRLTSEITALQEYIDEQESLIPLSEVDVGSSN